MSYEDTYTVDDRLTEADREWFFNQFDRFPMNEEELADAMELRDEDLRISMAEKSAQEE